MEYIIQFESKCNECGLYMGVYDNVSPYWRDGLAARFNNNWLEKQ